MKLLDKINYYLIIGIAKALGVFTMTWNRYQKILCWPSFLSIISVLSIMFKKL